MYAEALECALRNRDNLQHTSVLDVGKQLIKHLISLKDFETAALQLKKVFFSIVFYENYLDLYTQ